jgi:hypothetical protein
VPTDHKQSAGERSNQHARCSYEDIATHPAATSNQTTGTVVVRRQQPDDVMWESQEPAQNVHFSADVV